MTSNIGCTLIALMLVIVVGIAAFVATVTFDKSVNVSYKCNSDTVGIVTDSLLDLSGIPGAPLHVLSCHQFEDDNERSQLSGLSDMFCRVLFVEPTIFYVSDHRFLDHSAS
jgi:hypothetical protein